MKRSLALLAFSLVIIGSVSAQPAPQSPPPPTFSVVGKSYPEKGLLTFIAYVNVAEAVPVKKFVNQNGKKFELTTFETRIKQVAVEIYMDIAGSRVITPDGKQLPIDEVWKRAKAGTVIVRSADDKTPDQAYLRALNAETMVIIPSAIKKEAPPEPEKKP